MSGLRHTQRMSGIAPLPDPPYTAVIFSNLRTEGENGYAIMGKRMQLLAKEQPGYLGYETARDEAGFGITVSYWADDAAARAWKEVQEHAVAQQEVGMSGTPTTRSGSRPSDAPTARPDRQRSRSSVSSVGRTPADPDPTGSGGDSDGSRSARNAA